MKTLHLTLKADPFNVMVTGEKAEEFREPTAWIESRIVGKQYDQIKFVNGYGNDKPYFICENWGWLKVREDMTRRYTNGLSLEIKKGSYVILLGDILETGNLKK